MATNRVINSFDQIVGGEFKRTATDFHNRISNNGAYRPEAGRYVCYILCVSFPKGVTINILVYTEFTYAAFLTSFICFICSYFLPHADTLYMCPMPALGLIVV